MDIGHQILLTFSGAIFFGILFHLIAVKLRLPTIVALLLGGILVGPHGAGWIQPDCLGDGLKTIISIAVGIILFEGGLTLDIKGYKQVSQEIRGVLTKGVLITWLSSSLMIRLLFDFTWGFSLLAGSLIIVTGPTVIGPLLKRIRIKSNLRNLLHWEGVLIDPIGVFIALLCYEYIVDPSNQPLIGFIKRTVIGVLFGLVSGQIISFVIRKRWLPSESFNISVLASALAVLTISDLMADESGLLSVTIAGLVIGYQEKNRIEQFKIYKAELIQLLIALLFILLSANLDPTAFQAYGNKGIWAVIIVMIIIRPINIFVSTTDSNLIFREKLFLSWVAPRGIVAASMASLFALKLHEKGYSDAEFLETFTYAVIIGTVLFQGFTAGWVGRLLGVLEPKPKGWLIVGAHRLGRIVGSFIKTTGRPVILIDMNHRSTALARRDALTAITDNALTAPLDKHPEFYGVGNILAITENEELNTLVCQRWKKEIPGCKLFKWGTNNVSDDAVVDHQLLVGRKVWGDLKLSQLSHMDLGAEETGVIIEKNKIENVRHSERVLMCSRKGELTPFLPVGETGECSILTFRPVNIQIDLKIKPEWVMICDQELLSDVTRDLLDNLKASFPELNIQAVYDQLIDYENKYSSLICPSTALPHAYVSGIDDSIVLVAKLKKPIKSLHIDEMISLVFLVLSPRDEPRKHLNTLSEISKFMIDDDNRERLLTAQTKEKIIQIFGLSEDPD